MLRSSLTNRLGRRIALAGCAILLLTALVAYNQYASLLHRDVLMWYLAGASLLAAGLFLRAIGIVIFPLGIALFLLGVAHLVLLHFFDFRQLRFGVSTRDTVEQFEFAAVALGAILAVLGYFFRRTEYDEYIASARVVRYRAAPQTTYVGSAPQQRSSDACANCGKEMGMFTHALKCPACGRYWCADCCGRNSDGELLCPIDRVDNMGRSG
jgi:hypothetical protein